MESTFPLNNGAYTAQQEADHSQEGNMLMDLSVSSSNNHSVNSLLVQDNNNASLIDLSNQENKTQQSPVLSTANDQNSTLLDHHKLNQNYVENILEPEKIESDNHIYSHSTNNDIVNEQLPDQQPKYPNKAADDFVMPDKIQESVTETKDSKVADSVPLTHLYECKKEVGVIGEVDKVDIHDNTVDENELKETLNEVLKKDKTLILNKTEGCEADTKDKDLTPLKISINLPTPKLVSKATKVSGQKKIKSSPMKLPPAVFEGENDAYCWKCHKEGEVICCESCPRVYHLKCLNLKKNPEVENWFCPVCIKIMNAESAENPKKLPLDRFQLAEHLKYAVKRLEIAGSDPFRNPVDTNIFKDYREYIFHPMDVYTIEEKRKARKYGSTEAFGADVEWILHNCIVYNGVGKLSLIAKQMVKTAEFEMKEIEVCPECYLNAGKNRPDWFCEPCQKNHPLIWAKLAGFPHWPAKALKLDGKGLVDARFFGQHDRAWVREENCYLYSKELPHQVKNKKKAGAKGGLDNAIAEAQRYIDNVTKKFGKFEWASLRQPLAEGSRKISSYDYASGSIPDSSDADSTKADTLAFQIKTLSKKSSTTSSTPRKKSKVVTTSGHHPNRKKHSSSLNKTIKNLAEQVEKESVSDNDTSSTDTSEDESYHSQSKQVSSDSDEDLLSNSKANAKKKRNDMKMNKKDLKRKISDDTTRFTIKHRKSDISNNVIASEKNFPKKKNLDSLNKFESKSSIFEKIKKRESLSHTAIPNLLHKKKSFPGVDKAIKSASGKLQSSKIKKSNIVDKELSLSKSLKNFTIPKQGKSSRKDDGNSLSIDSNSSAKVMLLHKFNEKFTALHKQLTHELYDDVVKTASQDLIKTNNHLQTQVNAFKNKEQEYLRKISQLQSKLEKVQWESKQNVAESKHNNDLRIAEMRQSFENEKQQLAEEQKRKFASEHKKALEDAKKKSWCVMCMREADLHCCWNVSYCCTKCQLDHWPEHVDSCKNVDRSKHNDEDQVADQAEKDQEEPIVDDNLKDESDEDTMFIDEAAVSATQQGGNPELDPNAVKSKIEEDPASRYFNNVPLSSRPLKERMKAGDIIEPQEVFNHQPNSEVPISETIKFLSAEQAAQPSHSIETGSYFPPATSVNMTSASAFSGNFALPQPTSPTYTTSQLPSQGFSQNNNSGY